MHFTPDLRVGVPNSCREARPCARPLSAAARPLPSAQWPCHDPCPRSLPLPLFIASAPVHCPCHCHPPPPVLLSQVPKDSVKKGAAKLSDGAKITPGDHCCTHVGAR